MAWRDIDRRAALALALLVLAPLVLGDFWLVQILGRALILGLIALGLTLLAGFGGMVSLGQMTVAGVSAYTVAIFTTTGTGPALALPVLPAVGLALTLGVVAAGVIGLLAVRTSGIYTIMITLAIAVVFFYFTRQNYTLFNGFTGYAEVLPPAPWGRPAPFYYLCLAAAAAGYLWVVRLVASPFGLALQGVRDEPRRLEALGYNVHRHRVAAYLVAGVLGATGGILLVWFNTRIDPGTVSLGPVIDILVIAVIGGLSHPVGAFVGAFAFVLIDNFAVEAIPAARERFNLLIGTFFLLVVLFSPDGLLGIWRRLVRPPQDAD